MGQKQLQIVEDHINTSAAKTIQMITLSWHDQTFPNELTENINRMYKQNDKQIL